ncbi:MAG: pyridine nucleotide-disulfide oxidoreductase, partial [Lachnospiraceae bacterium]
DVLDVGELVKAIRIPKCPGYRCGYLKVRVRESIDFAITSLAYAYKEEDGIIRDARLVAGGVAPVPVRLVDVEQLLIGKKNTEELAEQAGKLACAKANPLKESGYKLHLLKTQIKNSLGK